MKKGPIRAIRHVATPSISFNYTPDFSIDRFGFYQEVQSDTLGNTQLSQSFKMVFMEVRENQRLEIYLSTLQIY